MPITSTFCWAVTVLILPCAGGCATYDYALVQPAEAAGALGGEPRPFDVEPLAYSVGVQDDRISVRVDNPTGGTVRLIGPDSSVVDPAGRSHPLVDQTIAPQSYVVVVLPPLRPWFGATATVGPTGPVEGPGDGDPGYDRSSPVYWDWPGPGDVRVRLVYRRSDGSTFQHELTVRRRTR